MEGALADPWCSAIPQGIIHKPTARHAIRTSFTLLFRWLIALRSMFPFSYCLESLYHRARVTPTRNVPSVTSPRSPPLKSVAWLRDEYGMGRYRDWETRCLFPS